MKIEGYHLEVSYGHKLYYETLGQPGNHPILFIHGGPGYGFFQQDKRFFNPQKHYVIFYDQRGCGKSLPYASIKENTTHTLLKDIDILLDHLKIEHVTLFGGSWGSTLALLYAMDNKDRIDSMILRGIFSATHDTIDLFDDTDLSFQLHEARKRAISMVPDEELVDPIGYFLEKMTNGNDDEKVKFAFELELYGARLNFPDVPEQKIISDLNNRDFFPHAIIMAHFAHNKFFLKDGYLWDNLSMVSEIPTQIVHGNKDLICPVENAYRLHEELNDSNLYIVEGGHSSLDPSIDKKLKEIMAEI